MKTSRIFLIILLFAGMCLMTVQPARATPGAEIQNTTMWKDAANYFHIFGEVKNTGDTWLEFVKVTGTLKDPSGTVVDVIFTFAQVDKVAPGSIAPFNLIESDTTKGNEVASYSLALDFRETQAIPVKLAILNTGDSKNSLGWLEVVGEVENQGETPSSFTKVTGTFYDGSGQVLYVGFTFTSPDTIAPGASNGFKLTVSSDERANAINHYTLVAEGKEYTSVPETPWPIIMLTAALTLAVVAVRRKESQATSSRVTE